MTNLADSGPGTLRSAITNAANGAVITFAPSLSGATITLSNTLTINTNLTIDASALPGGLQINGNGAVTVFNVATNITVLLNSLTITNGYHAFGGGIQNTGILTLTNCTLSGNYATYYGGGIYNGGLLTLNQCTLSGNTAIGFNVSGGGGGIYNDGALTLNQCTLSGNYAGPGNSAPGLGGGIFNAGTLTLNQSTLSGNTAIGYDAEGGGIYGNLAMTNTIFAENISMYGADIFCGSVTYGGSNLAQAVIYRRYTGPAPLTSNPDLAPLGNYGGPTQTMPPLPGSPAIGAGSVAANTFATDQRGYPRTQNGLIDLGAVELQSPASITKLANGDILIQFSGGVPGSLYDVEESSNLLTWTLAATDPANAMGNFSFEDTATAGVPKRYYRAVGAYSVGGTLAGLPAGDTVTLQDNGSDNLTLSANGPFTFPTALPDGHAYSITVRGIFFGGLTATTCTLTNGRGTISGANVTNVAAQCAYNPETCPVLTGNLDVDMLNAAVSDGTANGGVPGVMLTENGGPFLVTALGSCSHSVCLRYASYQGGCKLATIVGTTSCSSTTFPVGTLVIQFGTSLACQPDDLYGY